MSGAMGDLTCICSSHLQPAVVYYRKPVATRSRPLLESEGEKKKNRIRRKAVEAIDQSFGRTMLSNSQACGCDF